MEMDKPEDRNRENGSVERQASKWVWKVDQGLNAEEQDEFMSWLGSDPRFGEEYRLHAKSFKEFDQLIDWQPIHGATPNPDLLAPPEATARRRVIAAFGIAATIALVIGSVFLRVNEEVESIDIALNGGEVTLADNSVVHYNDGAEFEVDYSPSERRIILKSGEAYFGVEKDASRPFVVEVEGVELVAVGTAFNVRVGSEKLEVFVEEGIVEISNFASPESWKDFGSSGDGQSRQLGQFTKAIVSLKSIGDIPQLAVISQSELKQELSWQHRMLVFKGDSLKSAVAEFNRLNKTQFVFADSTMENFQISGTIMSDNVMGLCRILEVSFGISNKSIGPEQILLFQ